MENRKIIMILRFQMFTIKVHLLNYRSEDIADVSYMIKNFYFSGSEIYHIRNDNFTMRIVQKVG